MFPEAKFILLQRNPLSVFASILDYNFKGNINGILQSDRQADLYLAPQIIAQVKAKNLPNVFFINYEALVESNKAINQLMTFLGLSTFNGEVEYKVDQSFADTNAIDTKSVSSHQKPVKDYLDAWKRSINTHKKKKYALFYIKQLGPQLLTRIGYNYELIIKEIKSHKTKYRLQEALRAKIIIQYFKHKL